GLNDVLGILGTQRGPGQGFIHGIILSSPRLRVTVSPRSVLHYDAETRRLGDAERRREFGGRRRVMVRRLFRERSPREESFPRSDAALRRFPAGRAGCKEETGRKG